MKTLTDVGFGTRDGGLHAKETRQKSMEKISACKAPGKNSSNAPLGEPTDDWVLCRGGC